MPGPLMSASISSHSTLFTNPMVAYARTGATIVGWQIRLHSRDPPSPINGCFSYTPRCSACTRFPSRPPPTSLSSLGRKGTTLVPLFGRTSPWSSCSTTSCFPRKRGMNLPHLDALSRGGRGFLLHRVSLASSCHVEGCDVWKPVLFCLFESRNGNSCHAATRCIWVLIFS